MFGTRRASSLGLDVLSRSKIDTLHDYGKANAIAALPTYRRFMGISFATRGFNASLVFRVVCTRSRPN